MPTIGRPARLAPSARGRRASKIRCPRVVTRDTLRLAALQAGRVGETLANEIDGRDLGEDYDLLRKDETADDLGIPARLCLVEQIRCGKSPAPITVALD